MMAGTKGKSGGARKNSGGARPGAGRPRGAVFVGIRDCYLSNMMGINLKDCPKELINMKRESLLLKRSLRDLNKTLKEINCGN